MFLWIILFICPLSLFAQNVIIAPNVQGFSGDTATVAIEIENTDQFVGFQFDLPIPGAVLYIENSATLTNRANGHVLVANLLVGDTLRIISYSMGLIPFQGNTGPVVEIQVALANSPGNYPLELLNAVIADEYSQNILTSIENGNLIIIGPSPPNAFNLLSPDNGEVVTTCTPFLDWEDAVDPDPIDTISYTLFWSTDSSWLAYDSIYGLMDSEFTFSQSEPLPNNSSIWWKVKAVDSYNLECWSNQEWVFVTSSSGYVDSIVNTPIPNSHILHQNFPNPFNSTTVITYELSQATNIELSVCNVLGETIMHWSFSSQPAGRHSLCWTGTDQQGKIVASGLYFYYLQIDQIVNTNQMILIK